MNASVSSSKTVKTLTAIILHCAGPELEVTDVFDHLDFENEGNKYNANKPKGNLNNIEVLETMRFCNDTCSGSCLPLSTPFGQLTNQLKAQEKDEMVRDKIIIAIPKHPKEKLLRASDIILHETIDICLAHDQTSKNMREKEK